MKLIVQDIKNEATVASPIIFNDVEYFIHNDHMVEIHYYNKTRESRSVNEIRILKAIPEEVI